MTEQRTYWRERRGRGRDPTIQCDSTQGGQGERRVNCLVASTHKGHVSFGSFVIRSNDNQQQQVPTKSPFNSGGDPTHITDTSVYIYGFIVFIFIYVFAVIYSCILIFDRLILQLGHLTVVVLHKR